MGGNMRHASKGPDRRKSTCGQCATEFTHGKFTRRDYCDSCQESRRDPDGVCTQLDVTVDTDLQQLLVTVTIGNTNDVPVREIPTETLDEGSDDLIGYLRLESVDNGETFAAETGWVENFTYGFKLRRESSRSATFKWDGDTFEQMEIPTDRRGEVIAESFRDRVSMSRGTPFDAEAITVSFTPAVTSDELDAASETVDVPSYVVDL